jgi:hypothetical protein
MHEHVNRLIGLHGFEVRSVGKEGDQLDLEVELVAPIAHEAARESVRADGVSCA